MSGDALIILAPGFEEIETAAIIDILRRAKIRTVAAGLTPGLVTGSRGMKVQPDEVLDEYKHLPAAVILPGGSEGAENLAGSELVKKILLKVKAAGRLIAAICASPAVVLGPLGLIDGKTATCYPGLEKNFPAGVRYSNQPVIRDKNLITGQGPAAALEFSLKVAEAMAGEETAARVAKDLLCRD